MKRNYIPFIAGMSTMLLLVGLVGASLAGETRPPAVPQSGTLNLSLIHISEPTRH